MEIIEQDKIIAEEIKKGLIPDPATIDPATGLPFAEEDPAVGQNISAPMEPDIDGSSTEAPEMPKGGEI
jgi:hypothetical protein